MPAISELAQVFRPIVLVALPALITFAVLLSLNLLRARGDESPGVGKESVSSTANDSYSRFMFRDPTVTWFRLTVLVLAVYAASLLVIPENFASMLAWLLVIPENMAIIMVGTVNFAATLARVVTGALLMFVLPGFATSRHLPAREHMNGVEQLAFSVGISIVVTLLVALLLNFTPMGLSPTPILVMISLYVIVVSILATRKRFKFREAPSQSQRQGLSFMRSSGK